MRQNDTRQNEPEFIANPGSCLIAIMPFVKFVIAVAIAPRGIPLSFLAIATAFKARCR